MKKVISGILIIVFTFLLTDRVGGYVMGIAFKHSQSVQAPKLCHLAYHTTQDIILLGTSRCHCHYVPAIIADSLQMTVYNGGIDASNNIYSHYMALCYVLSCHKPDIVCLEVMEDDCHQADNSFETIQRFAPFYGMDDRADSLFKEAGLEWRYRFSHLYRYNATALTTITGLIQNMKANEEDGFYSLQKKDGMNSSLVLEEEQEPQPVDSIKLKYLQKFINLCKENQVKAVFMVSPKYTIPAPSQYAVLKSLAEANDVPFLDYHTRGLFLDHPELFRDNAHLWDEGARLYSSIFASDLKQLLFL